MSVMTFEELGELVTPGVSRILLANGETPAKDNTVPS